MSESKLNPDELAIILIDVQPAFVDQMAGLPEPVLMRLEQLLILVDWLQLPLLATLEEPVTRKGKLAQRLKDKFPSQGRLYHKQTYDLSEEPGITEALEQLQRQQLIIAGAETDVCVLQSVLGLLARKFQVFVLEDCLFSSTADTNAAIYRMRQSGAIPLTYKSLYYELLRTENSAAWRDGYQAALATGLLPVESLPPIRTGQDQTDTKKP